MLPIKIFHLDDNAFDLRKLRKNLDHRVIDGHELFVRSFLTIDEFLREATDQSETATICLIDIRIKGLMNGIDVVRKLRGSGNKSIIIMLSSLDDGETIVEAMTAGADDYIEKTASSDHLAASLYNAYQIATQRHETPSNSKRKAVGASMQKIEDQIPKILDSDVRTVHVYGEPGTGKEVVAKLFGEYLKPRKILSVNCAAISPSLMESELFGVVRGAYTGATTDRVGLIEKASGGWLFLDEVALLTPELQASLLRAIENQEIRRLGDSRNIKIDVRILSATNEDLRTKVEQGSFRKDLWERLCDIELNLLPLNERRDEIEPITKHLCRSLKNGPYTISNEVLKFLQVANWSGGNVRALRRIIRSMTTKTKSTHLTLACLDEKIKQQLFSSAGEPQMCVRKANLHSLATCLTETGDYNVLKDVLLLDLVRQMSRRHADLSLSKFSKLVNVPRQTVARKFSGLVKNGRVTQQELFGFLDWAPRAKEA